MVVLFVSQIEKANKNNNCETYYRVEIYFNEVNLKWELLDVLDNYVITQ